jgi:hypothetical protein
MAETADAAAIGAISPFFVVGNMSHSLDFYRRLGFEPRFREPAQDPFFAIVGRGGAQILLKHVEGVAAQPNPARHPWLAWDAFVHVPDPDALAEEFAADGVALHQPLGDRGDGLRGFEIADPDGYVLFFGRPI